MALSRGRKRLSKGPCRGTGGEALRSGEKMPRPCDLLESIRAMKGGATKERGD